MNILIAEDDVPSTIYLKSILSRYGKCAAAADGIAAVEAYSKACDANKPYDVVCLDIMLPKMDGLQVLSIIREIEKEKTNKPFCSKIIMVSALNDDLTIDHAREAGCDAYLWKPINLTKIEKVLESMGICLKVNSKRG